MLYITHSAAQAYGCTSQSVLAIALQVNQLLELESEQSMNTQKYTALDNWAKHLGATHQAILNKMA